MMQTKIYRIYRIHEAVITTYTTVQFLLHVRSFLTYNMYSVLRRLPSLVRRSNPSVICRGFCASSPFQVRRDLEERLSELEDEAESGTSSSSSFRRFLSIERIHHGSYYCLLYDP